MPGAHHAPDYQSGRMPAIMDWWFVNFMKTVPQWSASLRLAKNCSPQIEVQQSIELERDRVNYNRSGQSYSPDGAVDPKQTDASL